MKRILLTILLIFEVILSVNAQNPKLNQKMNAFYQYCLDVRKGVQQQNLNVLENCISGWDVEEKFLRYKNEQLKLAQFRDNEILPVDTFEQLSLNGHLQFSPAFVDSLIAYGVKLQNFPEITGLDFTGIPSLLRGPLDKPDCNFTHRVIKTGNHISLSFRAENECEVFLVSETGAKITASITLEGEKKPLQKETSDAPCFQWNMKLGRYILTIENPSKQDISVIIASN